MLAAGWVIIGKWYFNALAAVLIAFLVARLLRLDLFQVWGPASSYCRHGQPLCWVSTVEQG